MTPRELQRSSLLLSFSSFFFWLAGSGPFSLGERIRFKSPSRSVSARIEISFHNEIYFHKCVCQKDGIYCYFIYLCIKFEEYFNL